MLRSCAIDISKTIVSASDGSILGVGNFLLQRCSILDEDDHSVASSLSEHSDETYNETVSDPGSFANESSDDSVEDENLTGTQGLANVFAKILKKQASVY